MSSLQQIVDSHSWTTSPRYLKARQTHENALGMVNRAFGAYRALADEAARTDDETARTALYESSEKLWREYVRVSLLLEEAGNELLAASRG